MHPPGSAGLGKTQSHDLDLKSSQVQEPSSAASSVAKACAAFCGVFIVAIIIVIVLTSWEGPPTHNYATGNFASGEYCIVLATTPDSFNGTVFADLLAADVGVSPSQVVLTNWTRTDSFLVQCFYLTGFVDEAEAVYVAERLGINAFATVSSVFAVLVPPTLFNGTMAVTPSPMTIAPVSSTNAPSMPTTVAPEPGVVSDVVCGLAYTVTRRCAVGLLAVNGRCQCPNGTACAGGACTSSLSFSCAALPAQLVAAEALNCSVASAVNASCGASCVGTPGCIGYYLVPRRTAAEACKVQLRSAKGYGIFEQPSPPSGSQLCSVVNASVPAPATFDLQIPRVVVANQTATVGLRLSRAVDLPQFRLLITAEQGLFPVRQLNATNCTVFNSGLARCSSLTHAGGNATGPAVSVRVVDGDMMFAFTALTIDDVAIRVELAGSGASIDAVAPRLVRVRLPLIKGAFDIAPSAPLRVFMGWYSAPFRVTATRNLTSGDVSFHLSAEAAFAFVMVPATVTVRNGTSASQPFQLLALRRGTFDLSLDYTSAPSAVAAAALLAPNSIAGIDVVTLYDHSATPTEGLVEISSLGSATQSSTVANCATCAAGSANRVNRSVVPIAPQMTSFDPMDAAPVWNVTFASDVPIRRVVIVNNPINRERLRDLTIHVGDAAGRVLASSPQLNSGNHLLGPANLTFDFGRLLFARSVAVTKNNSATTGVLSIVNVLSMDYVEVWAAHEPGVAGNQMRARVTAEEAFGAATNVLTNENNGTDATFVDADNRTNTCPNCGPPEVLRDGSTCSGTHVAWNVTTVVWHASAAPAANGTNVTTNATSTTEMRNETRAARPILLVNLTEPHLLTRVVVHFAVGFAATPLTVTCRAYLTARVQYAAAVPGLASVADAAVVSIPVPLGIVADALELHFFATGGAAAPRLAVVDVTEVEVFALRKVSKVEADPF